MDCSPTVHSTVHPLFYNRGSCILSYGKVMGKDEMLGWHHQLSGHESEQALGDADQVVSRQKGTSLSSSNQQGSKALSAVHSLCNPHGLNEAGMAPLSLTTCKSLLKRTSIELMVSHISSPVTPFSTCPQSFPAPGSVPVSCLFASGAQSTEPQLQHQFLAMNIQDWFPSGFTDLICSPGDSRDRWD